MKCVRVGRRARESAILTNSSTERSGGPTAVDRPKEKGGQRNKSKINNCFLNPTHSKGNDRNPGKDGNLETSKTGERDATGEAEQGGLFIAYVPRTYSTP